MPPNNNKKKEVVLRTGHLLHKKPTASRRKRPDARILLLQSHETDLAIWSALYEATLKRDIFESAAAIGIDASRELLFF